MVRNSFCRKNIFDKFPNVLWVFTDPKEKLKKYDAYDKYNLNKKLIDFNEIPEELVDDFKKNVLFKKLGYLINSKNNYCCNCNVCCNGNNSKNN